jgi:hypothetical protein
MPYPTKIATCCYCGSRSMLKPTARGGHELACGKCGAPLHEMKAIKRVPEQPARPARQAQLPRDPYIEDVHGPARRQARPKRRKPMWKRVLSEVIDLAEDFFD